MNKQSPAPSPFAPESASWLDGLRRTGASVSTVDCYARDLRDVARALGQSETRCVALLDQTGVEMIAKKWREAGACDATVCRRFSALRGFASYLIRKRGMNLSALLSADFPTSPKRARPPINETNIGILLADGLQEGWRDVRDSAMFAVQSGSGLTPAETVKLNVGHVDLADRLIRVVDTHLAPRVVGLSDRSRDLIGEYLGALPFSITETEPLFVTSRRKRLNVRSAQVSFRRRRMRLGISEEATLMCLRHASAVRLANEAGSPDVLASALGVLRSTVLRYFDGKV